MMSAPFLVDSHCHLDFPDFDADRDDVVARATEQGIAVLLTISTHVSQANRLQQLTERYPNVYMSIGTHPLNVMNEAEASVDRLLSLAAGRNVVAIGEAGLDYFYDRAPREVQLRVFRRHIDASRLSGLPLIIHARDADEDMEAILTEEVGKGAFPFVLHCFSSSLRLAQVGVDLGGYVSFSGILTFKKSEDIRTVARAVPIDRLLVETDAPYLAPPPFRGKRNEPSFVRYTAEVLAEVKESDLATIAEATSDNFFRLFSKSNDPRKPL